MKFTATFHSKNRERTAGPGQRTVVCTKQADGNVRVAISAQGYYGGDTVLSDEVIPASAWPMIKELLRATDQFTVTEKS